MVWAETGDMGSQGNFPAGNYMNLDVVATVRAVNDSGTWRLIAAGNGISSAAIGAGYASEADAQEVARKLVDGVDPSTY
jgi:hypothetical protein